MKITKNVALFLLICFYGSHLLAQTKVYQLNLKEEINPAAWRSTKKAFEAAKQSGASVMVIDMNTYGGMLDYADSIRTKILNSKLKTIVYIDNNAASAGALISIACDKIYMVRGASIGAASVVNGNGEVLPEKYQSYMRGLMRTTAQAKGRDPKIAEAFVDPDVEVENISEKGKVLTLTTNEAIANGFCNGEAVSINDVLVKEGISDAQITQYHPTTTDFIIGFLTNPAVSSVLIIFIIGGIYFELQSPGIGFALLVAIVASLLFFAPLYIEGLAANWEILLFVAGIVLLILEIFLIPGFGIFGILGIIFMVIGLAMSLILNNFFDLSFSGDQRITQAFLIVLISMIAAIALSVIFGGNILKTSAFKRLVLSDEQQSNQGYQVKKPRIELLGKRGFAKTDLRPSGRIDIDGEWFDAVSDDGYIEHGTDILISKIENYNLVVRKA
ncbi:nodulation protein NfeD [Pedobacter sp. SD-b]|uniref:Nodulation protein NfeD n=1 Tax=Pedobacter segetis TaxID=2793069 RepID=A0ABS1BJ52_9SPHI|nr:nodulation protein NfeD [Pedobacter segetis]MBK0382924.1 nodulation protein NfeD [Pedobacter segetis]